MRYRYIFLQILTFSGDQIKKQSFKLALLGRRKSLAMRLRLIGTGTVHKKKHEGNTIRNFLDDKDLNFKVGLENFFNLVF
jgi:hypothetical protein